MKKYPAVYYYKEDKNKGIDLKYSIRSVIKNFPYSKIVLVGDKPEWYHEKENFIYIPSENKKSPSWTLGWAAFQHMIKLVKYADFEEFILFNDDFFVMKPVIEFKDMCRRESDYKLRVKVNRTYNSRVLKTLKYTKSKKYFNLHAPMRMKVSNVRELTDFWLKSKDKDLSFRTIYGNMFIEDYPHLIEVDDYKASHIRKDLLDPEKRTYYSTSSTDFIKPYSNAAKTIMEIFSEPSECES